jgi:hypothetical protein
MLGRLRMPLNQAIEAYMKLSESAFTEKNFAKRAMGGPLGAKFKTEALEDAIKTIIGEECETMLLKDADECRTYVKYRSMEVERHRTDRPAGSL